MADLELTLQGANFISDMEKVRRAVVATAQGVVTFVEAIQTINTTNNDTVLQKILVRMKELDSTGQTVVSRVETLNGVLTLNRRETIQNVAAVEKSIAADQAKAESLAKVTRGLEAKAEIEELINQRVVAAIKGPPLKQSSNKELLNLIQAKVELEKFTSANNISGEVVERVFTNFRNKTLTGADAVDGLARKVFNLIQALEAFGNASEKANKKAAASLAATNEENAKKFRQSEAARVPLALTRAGTAGSNLLSPDVTSSLRAQFLASEASFEKLVSTGQTTLPKLTLLVRDARSGFLNLGNATEVAEKAAVKFVQREEALAAAISRQSVASQAAVANVTALTRALLEQNRVAQLLEGRRQTVIQGPRVGSDVESGKLLAANEALARFARTGNISQQAIQAVFTQIETGAPVAANATEGLHQRVLAVVTAAREFGQAAEVAGNQFVASANRAAEAARILAAEQLAVTESAQVRQLTRPQGFDITAGGAATRGQQNQFLGAENALARLRLTEQATLPEIINDFARLRAGVLNVTNAFTASERAVEKLGAAQANLGAVAIENVSLLGNLSDSVINLFRIGAVSLFIGQLFRLQSVLEESVTRARDLSLALGQIATIEEGNVLSTTEWISSLRQLSESFGLPILDQAKAAYEALSNQIGEGAQTIKFLDAVNRLAITSLSTTTDASNLLASAINAFRLNADDAELVAAKLFRTVDLGRVKVTELANIFGQSAVPAHLLGVSLDELLAAFDITTQQGIKTEQAQTLIRNILIKLIKPTEEMKKVFQELGVATGESAIKTFGFGKFLAILEERTKGSSEELGQLFGEIRATTGAMVFAADGADKYADALDRTQKTTIVEFAAATAKVLQTTGEKFNIIGEQVKNFFEIEFGQHALKAIVGFIESMGGVNNILTKSVEIVKILADVALVGLLGSIGSSIVAATAGIPIFGALSTVFTSVAATSAAAAASIDIFTTAARAAALSVGVFSLAIAAIASVALLVSVSTQALEDDFHKLELVSAAAAKQQEENARVAQNAIQTSIEAQKRFIDSQIRIILQGIAERRKALNVEEDDIKKHASEIDRALNLSTKRFNSELNAKITAQTNLFNSAKRDAESAATEIAKIFEETGKKQLAFDLDKAGPGQKIKILQAQIESSRAEADAAAQRGDIETFKRASKNIQDLTEQRFEAEKKISDVKGETEQKLAEQRIKLLNAQTAEEQEAANAEIVRLNRHLRLAKTASELELSFVDRRQALIAQSNSGTFEEQINALNALQLLTNEKARAVDLAKQESNIRKQGLEDAQKLAQQYADLQDRSLATAKAAEEQAKALKAAQFTLDLLVKDSDAFDNSFKKTLSDGTQEEINKQLQEQQERILRIIDIQKQLGAGPESQKILLRHAASLEDQVINALNKKREEANAKAIGDARDRITKQQALERAANEEDIQRVEETINTISKIRATPQILKQLEARVNFESEQNLPESPQTARLIDLLTALQSFEDRLKSLKEGIGKLTTETPSDVVSKFADQTRALLSDLRQVDITPAERDQNPQLDALILLKPQLEQTSEALDNLASTNKNIEESNKLLEEAVKKQTGKVIEQAGSTERVNQTSQELIDTLVNKSGLLTPNTPSTVRRIDELTIPTADIKDELGDSVKLGVKGAAPQVQNTVTNAVTQGVVAAKPALTQAVTDGVVEGFRAGRQNLPSPAGLEAPQNQLQAESAQRVAILGGRPTGQPIPVTIAPTSGPAEAALTRQFGQRPGQAEAQSLLDAIRLRATVNPATGKIIGPTTDILAQQEIATRNNEATLRNLESLTQQNALVFTFLNSLSQALTPHLGFAKGGLVNGQPGHDKIFARLSNREFVMNQQATARFLPTLLAMNTGRLSPRGFAEGGPVDVGGVHVTVNESSSPQATANIVMSKINRGLRQGTIKFHKGRN